MSPFAGIPRLRRHLAADCELQFAAASALVALSNRTIAPEGSLHRGLALGPQQEAARLAVAARELLPYTVLVPYTCMRWLAADGLMHAGQQGWILQLLQDRSGSGGGAPRPGKRRCGKRCGWRQRRRRRRRRRSRRRKGFAAGSGAA